MAPAHFLHVFPIFILHRFSFFAQNQSNIMESGQMDIIFKISTSNYIGLQKFEPKQTEPAHFFNYFSILFLHLCSFFYRNPSNIKESGQMDIVFKISTSNYIGLQKFEPKRIKPAAIFNCFSISLLGPHRGQDRTRAP